MSSVPTGLPPEIIEFVAPKALTELLIRNHGLHEGFYELSVTFDITGGVFGFNEKQPQPGVACVFGGVGIARVEAPTERSVDAAIVNPAPVTKAKPTGRKPSKA